MPTNDQPTTSARRPQPKLTLGQRLSTIGAKLAIMVVILGAFAVIPAAVAYVALDAVDRSRAEAEKSEALTAIAMRLESTIQDLQSKAGGYVVTGGESFVHRWENARKRALQLSDSLVQTADGDSAAAADELKRLAVNYIETYSEPLVELADTDHDKAVARIDTGYGQQLVNHFTDRINEFVDTVQAESTAARQRAEEYSQRAETALFIGVVGGVIVALFTLYESNRTVTRPLRQLRRKLDDFGAGEMGSRAQLAGALEIRRLARTFNMMADQLQTGQKQLEAASEAKSDFLARMSHELRTPLNAILGFGQLLEMDRLHPEQAESVQQILKAGHHLLELIDEVLEISRIEASQLRISNEPVPLANVIADVNSMISPIADERQITVTATRDDENLHAMADQQRLKQILLNLLSNAIKYNRIGGTVTMACTAGVDGQVHISVTDSGPGISEDMVDRLFTPFERLGAETETTVHGTGLGLALSRRIAELMGGSLELADTGSQGSTFVLTLPQASPGVGGVAEASVAGPPVAGDPITVVYIEDNPSNFRLVERVFTDHMPATIYSSIQGSVGLDLVRRHRPDVVLLDLHLPDMHGEEVLTELRSDPETRDVPVIIVTADATMNPRRLVEEKGASAVLTKPLNVRELLDNVNRLTGGKGQTRTGEVDADA